MQKIATEEYIKIIKIIFGHNKHYPDREMLEWNLIKQYGEAYIDSEQLIILFNHYNNSKDEKEKELANIIYDLSQYKELSFSLTYFMLFLSPVSRTFNIKFVLDNFTKLYSFEKLVINKDLVGLSLKNVKDKNLPIYLIEKYFYDILPLEFIYNAELNYSVKNNFLNYYLIDYVNTNVSESLNYINDFDVTNLIGLKYTPELIGNKDFIRYLHSCLQSSTFKDVNTLVFILYFFGESNINIPDDIKKLIIKQMELISLNSLLNDIQKKSIQNYDKNLQLFGKTFDNIYKNDKCFFSFLKSLKNIYGDSLLEKIGLLNFSNSIDVMTYMKKNKNKDWIAYVFASKKYNIINYFCENGFVLNGIQKAYLQKEKNKKLLSNFPSLEKQLVLTNDFSFVEGLLDKDSKNNLKKLNNMMLPETEKEMILKGNKKIEEIIPDIIPVQILRSLQNDQEISLLNRMIFNDKLEKILILIEKGIELNAKQKKWFYYLISKRQNSECMESVFNYLNKLNEEEKTIFVNVILNEKMTRQINLIEDGPSFDMTFFKFIRENMKTNENLLFMMMFYQGRRSDYFLDIYNFLSEEMKSEFIERVGFREVIAKVLMFFETFVTENDDLKTFEDFPNAIDICLRIIQENKKEDFTMLLEEIKKLSRKNRNIIVILNCLENIVIEKTIDGFDDNLHKKRKRI